MLYILIRIAFYQLIHRSGSVCICFYLHRDKLICAANKEILLKRRIFLCIIIQTISLLYKRLCCKVLIKRPLIYTEIPIRTQIYLGLIIKTCY